MLKNLPRSRMLLALALCILPIAGNASEAAPPGEAVAKDDFDRFAPASASLDKSIDYSAWDEALDWFVLSMGVSLREGAPRREPGIGTRLIYGHDSRFRMEGNRVAFSFLEDEQRRALTDYRRDLEVIGGTIGLQSFLRNEQLAYWINLHNVAVIEQIALAYPVSSPREVMIGGAPLDEARFITVAGVAMSPQDIRTRIVYRHWRDPKVIYGFFRGDIGGPSIQSRAYNAANVGNLLAQSGSEFVNALRGVSSSGGTLQVSSVYEEARPFLFPDWPRDLRAHLASLAEPDVARLLARTVGVKASIWETDVADLSKGEREPDLSDTRENCFFEKGEQLPICQFRDISVPLAVQRFVGERNQKIVKLIREGKVGRVYLLGEEDAPPKEVK